MSDAAVSTIVMGAITITTAVVGFLTLWIRLKYNAKEVVEKVDENTKVTVEGTNAAASHAKAAENAASVAAHATAVISKKLNGGLDEALATAINPVSVSLEAHIKQDAKDMHDVNQKIDTLTNYIHQRNHEMLVAMNAHYLKMELLLKKLEK